MVSRDECKFETICLKIKNLHYLAEKKHMDVRTYISKTSGRGIKTGKKNMLTYRVWVMVFNATFNNISVISWWSVLLVEETGVSGEKHQNATSH